MPYLMRRHVLLSRVSTGFQQDCRSRSVAFWRRGEMAAEQMEGLEEISANKHIKISSRAET